MSLELVGVGETGSTDFTLVWPFSRVDPEMSPQIGNLDELSVAVAATVGLFARV